MGFRNPITSAVDQVARDAAAAAAVPQRTLSTADSGPRVVIDGGSGSGRLAAFTGDVDERYPGLLYAGRQLAEGDGGFPAPGLDVGLVQLRPPALNNDDAAAARGVYVYGGSRDGTQAPYTLIDGDLLHYGSVRGFLRPSGVGYVRECRSFVGFFSNLTRFDDYGNYAAAWGWMELYRGVDGTVTLEGTFRAKLALAANAGLVMGTLPVGFRPRKNLSFDVLVNGALGRVDVYPASGNVSLILNPATTADAYVGLGSLSWLAETL